MAQDAARLLWIAGVLSGAMAPVAAAPSACSTDTAAATVQAFKSLDAGVPDLKVANRSRYLAMDRADDLLVYRPYQRSASDGLDAVPRLAWRVVVVDAASDRPLMLLSRNDLNAEAATQTASGTDFRKVESKDEKTLLTFTPGFTEPHGYEGLPWQQTRLLVIGCGGPDGAVTQARAMLELPRSSVAWSRAIAIVSCVLCYLFAATATYWAHQLQRVDKHDTHPNQPKTGTHYASWWRHLDPVVLTAGGNGLGNATKLQIFFFSLLIFGVVAYIWVLTGQLTEMSSTVLLLMGISGIGATASAGTELTKNRLAFQNWSWLVNRGWLPKGGVAEANIAKWKDIVTTGGEFDATRFQMVTFSLLVGGALLTAGSELMDLSSFEIPTTLLGILGLSQVVYIGGKLTAPPAISDLDAQIEKLRSAETALATALAKVNTGSFMHTTVAMVDDPEVQTASAAYLHYLAEWETSKTMFETTLGQLVPQWAHDMRPPFDVPDLVKPTPNELREAQRSLPYAVSLAASGGVAPYGWALAKGMLPPGLALSPQGEISGTPTAPGATRFTLKVVDANGVVNSREFAIRVK